MPARARRQRSRTLAHSGRQPGPRLPCILKHGELRRSIQGGVVDDRQQLTQQVLDTVRRFVEREVMPVASRYEHADEYPQPLVERMKELGLFGATIPLEYGGLGLDYSTYSMIVEELCRGWMSLSGVLNTHLMFAYVLGAHGTREQKERYLPAMARGEHRAALCLTEPHAGSDPHRRRTTARRQGDPYVVHGSNMFITASRAVGVAQAAFEDAIRYAQQRTAFGKPICEHQAIQLKLADMATKIEAARLLTRRAAAMKDRGERCDLEAGMAKLFASEACQE